MNNLDVFIDKLSRKTTMSEIDWKPISEVKTENIMVSNVDLYSRINNIYVNNSKSFYFVYKEGYILLLNYDVDDLSFHVFTSKKSNEYYILAVQKGKDALVVDLNDKETAQPELIELYNLIIRKITGVDDLIDDFLNEL